jgi:hypothetical protein
VLIVSAAGAVEDTVSVHVPASASVQIVLRPATTLSGTLKDGKGAPAAGVPLVLEAGPDIACDRLLVPGIEPPSSLSGDHLLLRHTDASGAFSFPGVPEGTYTLRATLPGSGATSIRQIRFGPVRPSGGPYSLDLDAPMAAAITGRIVDESGAAYQNARLFVVATAEQAPNRWGNAVKRVAGTVEADGSFRVEGLTSLRYTLQVNVSPEASGQRHRTRDFRGIEAGRTDVLLRMTPGLTLRGRLVDDAGAPLGRWAMTAEESIAHDRTTSSRGTTTAGDGTFEIVDLDDVDYLLTTGSDAKGAQHRRVVAAKAPHGGADLGDVVATLEARIRGHVRNKAGSAVGGAFVGVLRETGGTVLTVVTDADGAFEETGLDPKMRYTVQFLRDQRAPIGVSGAVTVAPGPDDVSLVGE